MFSRGYNHHFHRPPEEILDEKRLTVNRKECSDLLAVTPYSDSDAHSDAHSDANLVVTVYSDSLLYSVVMPSDALYSSSDRGGSLYSVVIRESCLLYTE